MECKYKGDAGPPQAPLPAGLLKLRQPLQSSRREVPQRGTTAAEAKHAAGCGATCPAGQQWAEACIGVATWPQSAYYVSVCM